ncbi:MAG: hypothetical protein VKK32_07710 [Candidatus Melainabacteria bacterium]|nr:hypothetical protein [Candidatus Melainabacteria bacterium]
MNNLSGSGLTAIVEPAQKEGMLDLVKTRLEKNFARNGVGLDSSVPDEEIAITDLKGTERINSDSIPRSRIVPTGKLLSMKDSDSTDNADSSDLPPPLLSAVRAYKRLAYKGTSQAGMINLIDALLDYAKKQSLSDEETLKLYRKLDSDLIKSPLIEDACVRTMDNFRLALTAFMPHALEQKYEKKIALIKLAAAEYTEGLKQHLKELPQKLGSIELDGLAKEAALVYFQKTFEACKEEDIPKEDQKALLKYALKMKANAEFKFSTQFLLNILENPKQILGIAKDFLGALTAKIAKDSKLSGLLHFITDSVKHGLSLPDSDRTSLLA